MNVSPMLQQLIFYVVVIIWFVAGIVLVFRTNTLGKVYLRRLPPVNGVPLDIYRYVVPDWKRGWHGPVWRAYREQQADPELERLRQDVRRRGRTAWLWLFGFPVLVIGIAALLIATGVVRLQ